MATKVQKQQKRANIFSILVIFCHLNSLPKWIYLANSQFMIICKLVKYIWSVTFRSVLIWRVDYLITWQFFGIFLTWRNRWSSSTSPLTRPWRTWRRSLPSRPNSLLASEKFRRRKSIETNKSCESSSQEEESIVW